MSLVAHWIRLRLMLTKLWHAAPVRAAGGGSLCQLSSPDLEPPSVRCLDWPGTGFLRFVVTCTVRRVLFLMPPPPRARNAPPSSPAVEYESNMC